MNRGPNKKRRLRCSCLIGCSADRYTFGDGNSARMEKKMFYLRWGERVGADASGVLHSGALVVAPRCAAACLLRSARRGRRGRCRRVMRTPQCHRDPIGRPLGSCVRHLVTNHARARARVTDSDGGRRRRRHRDSSGASARSIHPRWEPPCRWPAAGSARRFSLDAHSRSRSLIEPLRPERNFRLMRIYMPRRGGESSLRRAFRRDAPEQPRGMHAMRHQHPVKSLVYAFAQFIALTERCMGVSLKFDTCALARKFSSMPEFWFDQRKMLVNFFILVLSVH